MVFIRFQPSEMAKIGLIIFYAGYLSEHRTELSSFKKGFVIPLAFMLPPVAILFFLQDHLSAAIIMIAITGIMMLMAGRSLYRYLVPGTRLNPIFTNRKI